MEQDWATLKDTVYATAFLHQGKTDQKNKDWFDEKDEQDRISPG